MNPLQRQLFLLTTLRAVRMFMISVPIIGIYWNNFGLQVKDIMLLQVVFSLVLVSLEMPSGYFADRFGNKTALFWGSVFGIIGYAVFWQVQSYAGFVVGEIILAIGASLISGSHDALLRDSLSAHNNEDKYQLYRGRQETWGLASEALAGVCAVIVYSQFGYNGVFAVQCLVLTALIPITLRLKPYDGSRRETVPIWETLQYCFYGNRRLLWLNVMTGTISASTLTMVWYNQLHWKSLGIDETNFGFIWSALLLAGTLGSHYADWIERQFRFRMLFAVFAVAPLILYSLMAALSTTLLSFAVLWLFSLLRGVTNPIVSNYVIRETNDQNRATVISANAMSMRIVFTIFGPTLGWVADAWSFGTAFTLSAIIFGSLALFGYVNWLATVREPASN